MTFFEAMNVEYRLSKRWLSVSLILTLVFYVSLIVSAFFSASISKWLALAAFILQLLIVAARHRSTAHYSMGESVRRPAVLQNGLGTKPAALQLAKITARYGISFSGEPITGGTYYESKTPPSLKRLLEITQESAFWTAELAERMAALLRVLIMIVAVILVIALVTALEAGLPVANGELIAKVVMATVTVWCTGDVFALWLKYESLASGVQRVLTDCEAMLSHSEIGYEAAVAFGEYNCALAAGPVIPDFIYEMNRNRLNVAWESRNAQGAPDSAHI